MSSAMSLEFLSINISSSVSGKSHEIINTTGSPEVSCDIENELGNLLPSSTSPQGFPEFFKIILHILYNLVLFGGVIGNTLVLYVIYSLPRMRTVTNYLLANLALGDLIIATLCVPFTYISIIFAHWPFGHFMCYFVSTFNAIGVLVSAFTLIALAIEKYVAILHPLAPRMRKSRVGWVIVVIWFTAIVTALPIGFVSEVRDGNDGNVTNVTIPICEELWGHPNHELAYNLALMMVQYFIPLGVLAFTYTRIAYVVWGIQHEKPSGPDGGINLNRNSRTDHNKSRKAVLLTLAVVAGYTLAWLPYNVSYIILRRYPQLYDLPEFDYISVACHWLAMSHCFYNPVIYAWINSSFKNAFKDVYHKVCCIKQDGFDKWPTTTSSGKYTSSFTRSSSTVRWKNYYRKFSCAPEPDAFRKFSVISPQKSEAIKIKAPYGGEPVVAFSM